MSGAPLTLKITDFQLKIILYSQYLEIKRSAIDSQESIKEKCEDLEDFMNYLAHENLLM